MNCFNVRQLGVAMRAGPSRIRPAHRGPARPAPHNLCGPHTLTHPTYTLARFLFFIYIKLSMFKNWETLRSSQN